MRFFYFFFFLLLVSNLYPFKGASYKIVEINNNIESYKVYAFTNSLIQNLEKYSLEYIPFEEDYNPDYLLFFDIKFMEYEETFIITTTIRSVSEKEKIIEDIVYTKDIWGSLGFEESGKHLAKRIVKLISGKTLTPYKELSDYRKIYTRRMTKDKYPIEYDMIDFLNVGIFYNEGVNFGSSLGFTLKLLEYSKIWLIPKTFFGIGIGIGIFDIHNTNAGGILPISLYIPLYIFPDTYEFNRKNLFLTAEWCGLLPYYSYYDVNLSYYFSGVGIKIGWTYYPYFKDKELERKEENKFYGGIFLFLGNYDLKVSEKKLTN